MDLLNSIIGVVLVVLLLGLLTYGLYWSTHIRLTKEEKESGRYK
jgi:hypothetical protein